MHGLGGLFVWFLHIEPHCSRWATKSLTSNYGLLHTSNMLQNLKKLFNSNLEHSHTKNSRAANLRLISLPMYVDARLYRTLSLGCF